MKEKYNINSLMSTIKSGIYYKKLREKSDINYRFLHITN